MAYFVRYHIEGTSYVVGPYETHEVAEAHATDVRGYTGVTDVSVRHRVGTPGFDARLGEPTVGGEAAGVTRNYGPGWRSCEWCDEALAPEEIEEGCHRECHVRQIVGSIGHQLGFCSCAGGTFEDPPELSKRDAARAAAKLVYWRSLCFAELRRLGDE